MRKKDWHQWIMYYEIHKRHWEGMKVSQIARDLGKDRRTIRKLLAMSKDDYLEHIEKQLYRQRILDPYEDFVRARLEMCEDASAAQVHDWLKEHFDDFKDVDAKTVFNFVLHVRTKYGIPKPFNYREYEKVPELPYGKQTQVDLGQYNMLTDEGKRKRIYFICFVLSRSRMKYTVYSELPFTTITVIYAHEKAIEFFGGITEVFVYDQDRLLLVDENIGDLILTEAFRKYAEYRGFKLHFCRKSDPESKGKSENVIKYHKHNFLRGRIFINIDILNSQGFGWLERTGNAKVHSTTKKVPYEEWLIEKEYLKPIVGSFQPEAALDTRNVIKDNTIPYKGNYYRVPRGTYRPPKTTVRIEVTDDKRLIIYNAKDLKIATHPIYQGKGKTIGGSNYQRDLSATIDQMIDELSSQFIDPEQTKEYMLQIRKDKPRYIRDQLQIIKKLTSNFEKEIIQQAITFCLENRIYRATDLESIAKGIKVKQSQEDTIEDPIVIKTINRKAEMIIPDKSNISDYQSLMY
jgi:transposase